MVLMFHLSDFAISNDFFMTKVMEFPTFFEKTFAKIARFADLQSQNEIFLR